MNVIGIDPGSSSGGIAFLKDNKEYEAYKMPDTPKDIYLLIKELKNKSGEDRLVAVLEKVNSMPGQGIVSAWSFSGNYHGLEMALYALEIEWYNPRPLEWQKALKIPKKSNDESKTQFKNRLKKEAQRLFPLITIRNYSADALLLAKFGYMNYV